MKTIAVCLSELTKANVEIGFCAVFANDGELVACDDKAHRQFEWKAVVRSLTTVATSGGEVAKQLGMGTWTPQQTDNIISTSTDEGHIVMMPINPQLWLACVVTVWLTPLGLVYLDMSRTAREIDEVVSGQ